MSAVAPLLDIIEQEHGLWSESSAGQPEFRQPADWLESASLPLVPHDHQRETFLKTWEAILNGGLESGLIVKPTGTGKSVEIALHVRYAWEALGWRTLVWVHRRKLIDQLIGTLEFMGNRCAREQAEHRARAAITESSAGLFDDPINCVVASAPTLRGERLEQWTRQDFQLMIRDEAHHVAAEGDQNIIRHFAGGTGYGPRLFGYTATPNRTDGTCLGETFSEVVDQMTFPEAVRIGALVKPVWVKSDVKVDLRGISTRGGDFSDEDLSDRIMTRLGPIVRSVVKEAGDRKTVLFLPGIKCSQMASEAINRLVLGKRWQPGVNDVSRAIWGDHPDADQILDDYAQGKFQFIANCDLLTEGWDDRGVRCVALTRKTLSASLLMQMIGRGTRRDDANGKEDCKYIDFQWQVDEQRDRIVSPYSLTAPEGTSDELLKAMEEVLSSGEAMDTDEALDRARDLVAERERIAKAEAERKAREQAQARRRQRQRELDLRGGGFAVSRTGPNINFQEYDPIGDGRVRQDGALIPQQDLDHLANMATERQVFYLGILGMPESDAKRLTGREASRRIGILKDRKKKGLATYRQVRMLALLGVPKGEAAKLSIRQASDRIDELKR